MLKQRTILLLVTASAISFQTIAGRHRGGGNFGETFGATLLGTAAGSTIGTALGNAISNPRPREVTREVVVTQTPVIVREVQVPNVMPARRIRQLEKEERCMRSDLFALKSRKQSLERRISSLEQELNEVEAAIEVKSIALRSIETKKREMADFSPHDEAADLEV